MEQQVCRQTMLALGLNAQLFFRRSAPLERAGYDISIADNTTDAQFLYTTGSFNVVVLGATIARDERNEMANQVKRRHPRTIVVMLVSSYEADLFLQPGGIADIYMESAGDMDDIVAELLRKLRPDAAVAGTCDQVNNECGQEA